MRITTMGPTDRLGAAIMPVPARIGQAYQTRGSVCGQPGTQPIAAPNPPSVPRDRSYVADVGPEWWRPSIYYQTGPAATLVSVSLESDNQMPVPALNPSGKPAVMLKSPTFLGQRQVGAINTITTFPWRGR